MNGNRNLIDDIVQDLILIEIIRSLENVKTELQTNRTFKLWLQNMDVTDTLQQFLRAEHTGKWELPLSCLTCL